MRPIGIWATSGHENLSQETTVCRIARHRATRRELGALSRWGRTCTESHFVKICFTFGLCAAGSLGAAPPTGRTLMLRKALVSRGAGARPVRAARQRRGRLQESEAAPCAGDDPRICRSDRGEARRQSQHHTAWRPPPFEPILGKQGLARLTAWRRPRLRSSPKPVAGRLRELPLLSSEMMETTVYRPGRPPTMWTCSRNTLVGQPDTRRSRRPLLSPASRCWAHTP